MSYATHIVSKVLVGVPRIQDKLHDHDWLWLQKRGTEDVRDEEAEVRSKKKETVSPCALPRERIDKVWSTTLMFSRRPRVSDSGDLLVTQVPSRADGQ